jgi:L-malate glycosyltransferase
VIRVCLVGPAWMTGGQAVEARTLVHGFARGGEVEVELLPIDPKIPRWLAGVRGLRTLAKLPIFYAGLVRQALRADVFHVFTAAFWPFLLTTTPAVLTARLFGRPVILNYRDGRARDHIRHAPIRWIVRRATVLVFPSDFLREVFAEFGLHGVVVPNVVDTERFRYRERRPLRPVLLSSRLLEELYDVDNTILAFEQIVAQRPDARLLIIGDGDQRPRLEQLVLDRRIRGVEFVGAVSHHEMGEWFDRADILVNSSRIDNMPHCLIEAFAAGMPIVTTPSGGIPFIVEDRRTGLFVSIGQPDAMAAAVLELLDDAALAERLTRAGSEECERRYAWTAARGSWLELYRRLTGRAAPAKQTPVAEVGRG